MWKHGWRPYVQANVDKINMAHAGVGSISFSCGRLLNSILGVKPAMVPFNGAAAMNALIGGQVDYMCDGGAINSVPHVQSGAIKAYLFEAERRSPLVPDVPTAKEAGLPEFRVLGWNGLFAPRARRNRSSTNSPMPWTRHWTIRTSASESASLPLKFPTGQAAGNSHSRPWCEATLLAGRGS
jgi:tripartite tricarboxylate transporter family receptor